MRETHPFGVSVPKNSLFLLPGSFPGKDSGDWFYGSKKPIPEILEKAYGIKLENKNQIQRLM